MDNLLFISNLFPNSLNPNMASFNRQQIQALGHYFNIDVVAPVAWQVKLKNQKKISPCNLDSITSYHPTYYYTPGILRNLYGPFFYQSIHQCIEALLKKKNYHAIYGSWLYPDGWACAKLAKRLGIPLFLKVHGTDVNQLESGTSITEQSMFAISQAKAVFCVSHALRDRLIELGASSDKLHVIYNGVDTSIFKPFSRDNARIKMGIKAVEKIILYVGNIKKTKGLSELAQSFNQVLNNVKFVDSRLIIVGNGPYLTKLKLELSDLNLLSKVTFTGSLSLEQIAVWMNAADLLCLPSYMEGVPNVVLEALSCGTSVVATSVGGIPELKTAGRDLLLVPPRNVAELTKALMFSLESKKQTSNEAPIHSWDENARQLLKHMKEDV